MPTPNITSSSFLWAHLKWLVPVLVALPIMVAILYGMNVAGLLGLTFASAATIHCVIMIGLCAITWQCLNWVLIPLTRMAHPNFKDHLNESFQTTSSLEEKAAQLEKKDSRKVETEFRTQNGFNLANNRVDKDLMQKKLLRKKVLGRKFFKAAKQGRRQDRWLKAFWALYLMALPLLVPHVGLVASPFLTGLTLFMAPVMLMLLSFVVRYYRYRKTPKEARPYWYMIVHCQMALVPILVLGAVACAAWYQPALMAHLSSAWLWTQVFPAVVLGAVVVSLGMHLVMNIWHDDSLHWLLFEGFGWLPKRMGCSQKVYKGIASVCMSIFFLPVAWLQWSWALMARPNEMMSAYQLWCQQDDSVRDEKLECLKCEGKCVLAKAFQVHRDCSLLLLMGGLDDDSGASQVLKT